MEYIEIAKFKLKEGFADEQFIEAEKSVRNGLIKTQKGFISRELSKDQEGFWLMDMRFDNKENMDVWFEALKQDPTMKVLGSMIDFPNVRMEFFTYPSLQTRGKQLCI
ncbi:MAG: antibiotic biosynthesis monooxygenase [Bacteroidia bacterium]|jgi:heme-degrading monooxygenase HmoA